jgi:streptomycin 6-kinase
MTMRTRFGSLANAAEASGPHRAIFSRAWDMARGLLAAPAEFVVLHGDVHHRNVLHDPARGWVAIDPKGVLGNRALEYATIFYNPTDAVALRPGRLRASARLVAAVAGIDEREILQWAFANAALSACWSIESARPATSALTTAGVIEAELMT